MGQQQRDQFGVLVQLHGVLALVGKQSANVNSEIHFVGEARQERQHQFVVVVWGNKIRRQSIALAEIVCGREGGGGVEKKGSQLDWKDKSFDGIFELAMGKLETTFPSMHLNHYFTHLINPAAALDPH